MDVQHPLAVVTPTLDGDVLTRLALADAAFTPGQLSKLVPTGSVAGIRKVLNRLTDHGIVIATRAGNAAIIYALNREHLAADAIIALAEQPTMLRKRIDALLTGWSIPPVYASIFGSWARGEATTASDVDLLLVRPADAPDDLWDAQVGSLEDAVSRWTGNDARAFVVMEHRLPSVDQEPVLGSVVRDGLTLHGSAAWFRTAVAYGARHEPERRHDAHNEG
jgi:predicted nucleotidyltransferase